MNTPARTASLQSAVPHANAPTVLKGEVQPLASFDNLEYWERVEERIAVDSLRKQVQRVGRIRPLEFDAF